MVGAGMTLNLLLQFPEVPRITGFPYSHPGTSIRKRKRSCYQGLIRSRNLPGCPCLRASVLLSGGGPGWQITAGSCLLKAHRQHVLHSFQVSWLIGKDSDAGRDWGQEEKGMTEDEMAGWHHWLNGRESEWTQGVGDGQGGLACCDSWGRKESDTTERLNWTEAESMADSSLGWNLWQPQL